MDRAHPDLAGERGGRLSRRGRARLLGLAIAVIPAAGAHAQPGPPTAPPVTAPPPAAPRTAAAAVAPIPETPGAPAQAALGGERPAAADPAGDAPAAAAISRAGRSEWPADEARRLSLDVAPGAKPAASRPFTDDLNIFRR